MSSEPPADDHRRLVIAGSGIAGLSAAIYAARSNNEPLVLEGDEPGGQLTLTTDVENYPGFPEGISGPDLINEMKTQAEKFGTDIENGVLDDVTVKGEGADRQFRITLTDDTVYTADAVIAASGASARTLGIPGEDELMGWGLSTCATCDGAFFRDEKIVVVGGGDAAMEEAHFLTKFASTVYIVHRREEFRAEDVWIERVMEKVDAGEIEIMRNTEVTELHGTQADGIDHVTMVSNPEGHPTEKLGDPDTEEFEFDAGAVFYAIGHTPNTDYLEGIGVDTDDEGYLITESGRGGGQTKTGVEGLFGAGDVVDFHYQQAATAAGMGVQAALDADDYLDELDRKQAAAARDAGAAAAESDD
ncbi:NAD(P)/FAD-dependent oxidoreductase [Halonotius roseus]|uniref:Thioredoxin reductase n=1 Tax=Halonotius roseus TaxID=2511997 RepID=A0A544QQQ6_9EURY|nr:FAD-dependent oxidoreductase [Halonotius roseus]TQQ81777.1 thioredoxin reductase [Halonotius roseus]